MILKTTLIVFGLLNLLDHAESVDLGKNQVAVAIDFGVNIGDGAGAANTETTGPTIPETVIEISMNLAWNAETETCIETTTTRTDGVVTASEQ